MKTGELKIVCRKKVSNIDWWEDAIKNFSLWIMFSSPLMIIFVDRKNFKQKLAQLPINFPPIKIIFWGKIRAGKNIKEIIITPVKKKIENTKFLIISIKS